MRGEPVKPETRARAIELMKAGVGRNAIARELEISGGSVTRIARDAGHEFDWAQTEIATRAANIQNDELRSRLAKVALLRAIDAAEAMDSPHTLVHYQPKTKREPGGWKTHILDEPTPSDKRNYATIFGIMVSKASELARQSAAAGDAGAISIIEGLSSSLAAVADRLRDDAESDPTAPPSVDSREALIAQYAADVEQETGADDVE